ncbi:hypothetical protein [Phenylobacterium soli]|uniref:hypothetical protein n=1 Tax=Phenylobacterium soli TaxID=2170551 RepID=UPI001057F3F5|nr:hypothetical protein [Phenylobacterium soli]
MYPRDWKLFLRHGQGKEIAVAQLSADMVAHLNAASDKVFYRHDYVMKAFAQHGTRHDDFGYLFDVVDYGRALLDRPNHILFMHLTPRGWFQAAVKCSKDTRRLYVCTFYKTNNLEVNRKTRKYPVLRKDKWTA